MGSQDPNERFKDAPWRRATDLEQRPKRLQELILRRTLHPNPNGPGAQPGLVLIGPATCWTMILLTFAQPGDTDVGKTGHSGVSIICAHQ
jgi:hypothetical protein